MGYKRNMTAAFDLNDACGAGFAADLEARPGRASLDAALRMLRRADSADADPRRAVGSGVTVQLPYALLEADLERLGVHVGAAGDLAAGLVFLPGDAAEARACKRVVAESLARQGLRYLGWRGVPIEEEVLSGAARRSQPAIAHLLAGRPLGLPHEQFERRLFLARKEMERRLGSERFYVASLSHRTLVYKAPLRGSDLARFYLDLRDPALATAATLLHGGLGAEGAAVWARTQPYRMLAHRGSIRSIAANRRWMQAREADLQCRAFEGGTAWLRPVLQDGLGDSANLDNAFELLALAGRHPAHALAMLVPPSWEDDAELTPEVRAFFEYHSCLMEPWDGPSVVFFTDGRTVGAGVDRSGSCAARYLVTRGGLVAAWSGACALEPEASEIASSGALRPGDMVAVDLGTRSFLDPDALRRRLAARRPYAEWLALRSQCRKARIGPTPELDSEARARLRTAFGCAEGAALHDALSACFVPPRAEPAARAAAQAVRVGPRLNLLAETPQHASQLVLSGPVVLEEELELLVAWEMEGWTARRLSLLFPRAGGLAAFRRALDALVVSAATAAEDGAAILVLSDRGVAARHAALPPLLAVSAVHQHLLRQGLRMRTSLVAETGEAEDAHHIAALVALGASAVNPYLALGAARAHVRDLSAGVLRIVSSAGISDLASFHGSQLFDANGLGPELVERHFTGVRGRAGRIGLAEIAADVLARHDLAFASAAVSQEHEPPLGEPSL